MKRYYAVVLLLFFSGQLIPASTRIAASTRQNPLTSLGFDQCAGLPCFLGIIPGKTNWQDATSILLKHGFARDLDASDLSYSKFEPNEPFQIGIYVYRVPDKLGVVHAIDLSDPQEKYKVTLADVLELYGFPCKVESDYKGSVWLAYPNILVHTLLDNESLYSWKAPIEYLHLLDPQMRISVSGITVCDKVQYTPEYLLWFTF